jgi:protein-tyrosine phosphatase
MNGPKQLLFLCTGNICRSPLAHVYAEAKLAARGLDQVAVTSASTLGLVGNPAHDLSVQAAREQDGLDLSGHRSRPLTKFLLQESDLVLVMSEEHREQCNRMFKSGRERVKLLGAFRPDGRDKAPQGEIDDPLGSDYEYFLEIYAQIKEGVDGLLTAIYG